MQRSLAIDAWSIVRLMHLTSCTVWGRGCRSALSAALVAAAAPALIGCARPKPPPPPVYYPPLPNRPRVQFLCSLISSEDVEPEPSAFARFILGADLNRPVDYLVRPYGLAFWKGKLYVCDSGARRGALFDFAGQEFRPFGHQGAYRLQMPINVHVGPRGEKYVTDTLGGRILVLGADDRPVRSLTGPEGMRPCGVAWHDGELYVGDLGSDAVLVLDPRTGALRRRLGGRGGQPGRFSQPTNLAVGPDGALFVSDTLNARVQKLDRHGRVLQVFGSRGRALGQMVRPKGLAVDREGTLYVADAAAESVLVFNRNGQLLMLLGAPGVGRGDLSLPANVTISYEGIEYFRQYAAERFQVEYLIFVSNQLGPNKISVYGFGAYRGPEVQGAGEGAPTSPPADGNGE